MKVIIAAALLVFLRTGANAEHEQLTLTHLRGNVYVVEDTYPLSAENSAVYVGDEFVTAVGATWTPETARLLANAVAKITRKPIREVIDTNYNLDRAGGNAYFKSIGARIVSTTLTHDLLQREWATMVEHAKESFPGYPDNPLVLPDTTHPGDFELQGGRIRCIYLGPSHAPDDIFVYFPEEKVLYGGCILKEQLGNLALANLVEYPKTLQKLKRLDLGYTTIIAGHWSPIHGPELVDQNLRLLELNQSQHPVQ
ncbi:MAG: subclass B2 metallo-beta-lactamase [Bryobacteraceae bacterium]